MSSDSKIPKADENTKALLVQLDIFIAKAYSAYVHAAGFNLFDSKPRLTLDECVQLQERIRLITGNEG